ncbi:unnamed protein product [Aureobasidium mustum]|uniref:YjgF-like protein n=1 Tax=Aureobasidium mustum TaxID=2773714 RepID=A0A9N8P8L5_9PEZI|nr:unnamed protein product [Aureobasidium mustum]
MMNYVARSIRVGASSILHSRLPSSFIARKSTLTQVFSEKAIHPIKANGFVFLSAQLPADENCKLVGGSVSNQTHKMLQNASHVLQAAGSKLENVVKVNLFVKDFHMIEEVNEVYAEYFPQRPARTAGQVTFMPAGAEMMVDLVAVVDEE